MVLPPNLMHRTQQNNGAQPFFFLQSCSFTETRYNLDQSDRWFINSSKQTIISAHLGLFLTTFSLSFSLLAFRDLANKLSIPMSVGNCQLQTEISSCTISCLCTTVVHCSPFNHHYFYYFDSTWQSHPSSWSFPRTNITSGCAMGAPSIEAPPTMSAASTTIIQFGGAIYNRWLKCYNVTIWLWQLSIDNCEAFKYCAERRPL